MGDAPAMGGTGLRVVFLSHAAERSGPPIMLLHFLRWLCDNAEVDAHVVFLRDGELRAAFSEVAEVSILDEFDLPTGLVLAEVALPRLGLQRLATRLRSRTLRRRLSCAGGADVVYVNTAASVRALRYLPEPPSVVVTHVHELEVGLELHLPPEDRDLIERSTTHYIAASNAVRQLVLDRFAVRADHVTVIHEFVDTDDVGSPDEAAALRGALGIGVVTPVVGSMGQPSWRKAPDLFVHVARLVSRRMEAEQPHFVWVGGDPESEELAAARYDADRAGLADRVHFVPHDDRPTRWNRVFDVFALPAREDAFPLVCLEAAVAGIPVVCFDRGGIPELIGNDEAGFTVPYPDLDAFADRVVRLLRDRDLARSLGAEAAARVRRDHGIATSSRRILDLLEGLT